jgi:PIN domain nuclease of toxin-antitoxin system
MLLLDSQALLWLLDDNPRLGPQARAAITSAQGVHVSAATVWELTIKSVLGKLTVSADIRKRLAGQGLDLLSVTAEHAAAIRDFPEATRHPFDRLIVAQASRVGLASSPATMSCWTCAATSSSTHHANHGPGKPDASPRRATSHAWAGRQRSYRPRRGWPGLEKM